MSDSPSHHLPAICDAALDEQQLSDLFRDLRACACIERILVRPPRGVASTPESPQSITLDEAQRMLQSRTAAGVQIHYAFDGIRWIDTFMVAANGVRLVRAQRQTE